MLPSASAWTFFVVGVAELGVLFTREAIGAELSDRCFR